MVVVILAAGQGRRLSPLTDSCPKCLLPLGQSTFLEFQTDLARRAGLDEIVVVTGFCAEQVRARIGDSVTFVHNADFETTNSLYSFMLTEKRVQNGCIVMNSDVVFHPDLLRMLVQSPSENALLVDFDAQLGEEEMKVIADADGRLLQISKDLAPWESDGENIGIVRLGPEAALAILEEAHDAMACGHGNLWLPQGVQRVLDRVRFSCVPVGKRPWIEVDYRHDLTRAQEEIYPVCCPEPQRGKKN